ncbi:MAG: hypothetical protein ACREHG_03780 [Candidatus Saccharimonadales bacterium]
MTASETTPQSSDDVELKQYIVSTLDRFLGSESDGFGRVLFGLLRRMLQRADHDDIIQVLSELDKFTANIRDSGFLNETGTHRNTRAGSGIISRPDSAGEVNIGQVFDNDFSSRLSGEIWPDISSGYEAAVEGNMVHQERVTSPVSLDGTGRRATSDDTDVDGSMAISVGSEAQPNRDSDSAEYD